MTRRRSPNEKEILRQAYLQLLDTVSHEQQVQDFLEEHSELIPLEWILGHGLHFDLVLSKLQINTSFVSDFAYLTKNTGQWYVVLIELENPNKPIFRKDKKRVRFSAQFNEAVSQIQSWSSELKRRSEEIRRKLNPLMLHMSDNPIDYKFILVYGRDKEFGQSKARRERFADKSDDRFHLLTYDSLARRLDSYYSSRSKNIFTMSQQQFCLKHLHNLDTGMLGWMSRDYVSIGREEERRLTEAGFEMEEWNKGNLLTCATAGYQGTSFKKMTDIVLHAVREENKKNSR